MEVICHVCIVMSLGMGCGYMCMSEVACGHQKRAGAEVLGGNEPTDMAARNSGSLEKQQVLLTQDLPLQPPNNTPNDHGFSFFQNAFFTT